MQEYRIRRDGQQYLVFSGCLVGEVSDRLRHGAAQDRWTDIRVYRTATGGYVVEQVMPTLWQKGEGVWYKGDLCTTPQEVYIVLVGSEADSILSDLEKELLVRPSTSSRALLGIAAIIPASPLRGASCSSLTHARTSCTLKSIASGFGGTSRGWFPCTCS